MKKIRKSLIIVAKKFKKIVESKNGEKAYKESIIELNNLLKKYKKNEFDIVDELMLNLLQTISHLYKVVADEMEYLAQEAKKLNEAIG